MATTTANLGLTKPDYTEKADVAVINGNMDKIDAAVQQRSRVWNLLDNSDFRDPINQRGASSYTGAAYAIDRWRAWVDSNTLTIHAGYITTTGDYAQYVRGLSDGTYSAFAMRTDGTLIQINTGYESANDWRYVTLPAGSYVWAALYEGEYTIETCPAYMPKGYTAELLECQRYYYKIPSNGFVSYCGFAGSATNMRATVPTPVPMRATPSITVKTVSNINIFTESNAGATTAVEVSGVDGNTVLLNLTTSGLTAWKPCVMRFNTTAALSADL